MNAYDFWYHILSGIGKVVMGVVPVCAIAVIGVAGLAPEILCEALKTLRRRKMNP